MMQETAGEASLAETREDYIARCANAENFFALEGRCADGTSILDFGSGTSNEWRYFDADGAFVAAEFSTDAPLGGCNRTYFPERIVCEAPVITAVLCGRVAAEVGGRLVH
jgi:hypothetical protein